MLHRHITNIGVQATKTVRHAWSPGISAAAEIVTQLVNHVETCEQQQLLQGKINATKVNELI